MSGQRAGGSVQGLALLGPSQAPGGVSCLSFTLRGLGRGWEGKAEGEGNKVEGKALPQSFPTGPHLVPGDHRGGQANREALVCLDALLPPEQFQRLFLSHSRWQAVRLMGMATVYIREEDFCHGNKASVKVQKPMFHLDKPVLLEKKLCYETRSRPGKKRPPGLGFQSLESELAFPSRSPLTGAAVCVGTGCWPPKAGRAACCCVGSRWGGRRLGGLLMGRGAES